MIKWAALIALILLISFPQNANAEYQVDWCKISWKSISSGETCSTFRQEHYQCSRGGSGEDTGSCVSPLESCFAHFIWNDSEIIPINDVKAGSVSVEMLTSQMIPSNNEGWIMMISKINEYKDVIGCGTNADENECPKLYDQLFNKLSKKFPLDIFVPVYNFNSDATACPKITLFGHTLEFCAITMVGKSVRYIFLISFIIRSVMSL